MKKIRVISLVLALAFLIAVPIGVRAADKAVFSVKTPEILPKAGETFGVTVELANNPGFCAIQFTLAYDRDLMQCGSAETDGILSRALAATNPNAAEGAIIAAASVRALKGDGAVARFTFVAKQDIGEFGYKLTNIALTDEDDKNILCEVAGGNGETTQPPEDIAPQPPIEENPEEMEPKPPVEDVPSQDVGVEGGIENGSDAVEDDERTEESETPGMATEPDNGEEEKVELFDFPDVVGHWSEPFVGKAVQQGLFMGDNEGNFRPDDSITRAQFVTVLWRMAGRPEADTTLPFADVADQIPEFKSAIAWAYANGHVNGTSETTFDPAATLTREAAMKILHSYAGGKTGMEFQFYAIYDGAFVDSAEISSWAKPSVYWGIYNTLISGVTTDTLVPKGTATRAQLAKILVTYLDI